MVRCLSLCAVLGLGAWAAARAEAPARPADAAVYIVRLAHGDLAAFRRAAAARDRVRKVEPLAGLNMVLVTTDPAGARALATLPGVLGVRADAVRLLDAPAPSVLGASPWSVGWNLPAVGADQAWQSLGVTGEGVVIAALDSGADWLHPALRGRYRGRLGDHDHNWYDATAADAGPVPVDPHGHGTQVLGVALGRAEEVTYGVAPGAEWIAARAFDAQGRATDSALLRAAAWLLAPTDRLGRQPRPDLAPDIVVCSWALGNGADPLFEAVLDAWRAAGILVVCAAGNDDLSGGGRVLAPASDPDAVAVGASVPGGAPWARSRRGPGFAAPDKPDLLAPGVGIRVPVPGGGEAVVDGTSFAAPHAAGAAALARSADPDLTAEDLATFLRQTARDRAPPGPDPVAGWGNLDAAALATAALTAGRLAGQVTWPDGRPAPGTVRLRPAAAGPDWTAPVHATGHYSLALPAGAWSVWASTFGGASERRMVHVADDGPTRLDLVAQPAVNGELAGRVADDVGQPLAEVEARALAGGPGAVVAAGGAYRLALPAGRHVVRFAAADHRAVTTTVAITAGRTTTADVSLAPAPRVLVVDADAWRGERVQPYLVRALADVGVTATVWPLDGLAPGLCEANDVAVCLPSGPTLARHDLVFWLHDRGSPGLLDTAHGVPAVARWLEAFLARGGRLVLAGQDVGWHDAPEGARERRLAPDLYRRVLGARWLADLAPDRVAQGRGPLAGLTLDLRWAGGGGVGQTWAPDVVAPAVGADGVEPILVYSDGRAAALGVTDAALGRRAYLAFGLHQAGGRVALAALVDRLLAWLAPPRLALAAGSRLLAPGASTAITVTARAGPAEAPLDLALRLPSSLAVRRLPPDMVDTGAGELRWTGRLRAGTVRELPVAVDLVGPAGGARPLQVVATGASWRRPVTATLALWPVTPDLSASRLTVVPGRLAAGGAVTVVLGLANTGPVPARAATAVFTLPALFDLDVARAGATSGALTPDPAGPRWLGDVSAGQRVTVTLPGRLPNASGTRAFGVRLDDQAGLVTEPGALALQGGPDLRPSSLAVPGPAVAPGATVTATLRLVNAGDQAAVVGARLTLPPGLHHAGPQPSVGDAVDLRWPEPLEPGASRALSLPLRLASDQASGTLDLRLALDDGARPARVLVLSARLVVRAPDLRHARLVLWPERVRSGDAVTGTLLVANSGDAPAGVAADVVLPPTVLLDPAPPRASTGTVTGGLGWLGWSVDAPAANGDYAWHVDPGARFDTADARPIEPGRVFDLGMPFPLHTAVYTRAVVTADGLLTLGGAVSPESMPVGAAANGGVALPVAAVAPLWRPRAAGAPLPRVQRAADAVTVVWPADLVAAAFAVTLFADGGLVFAYGPGADGRGALVGVGPGTDGGAAVEVPVEAVVGGRGLVFRPPLDWRWLRFRARAAQGLGPNSLATVGLRLRGPLGELSRSATLRANPLRLDGTTLVAVPGVAAPGGRVRHELTLVAAGSGEARAVEVTVDLPDAAQLEPGSATPGLEADAEPGRLRWRGRVAVGAARRLDWAVRLDPGLTPGGRLLTTVDVLATGVSRVRRTVAVPVQATDFSGSAKLASRAVLVPGEVVTFTLRARHVGPGRRRVRLVDALPDRLVLVPASLTASLAPPPRWDAASRSLQWSGELAPDETAEITLATRFAGGDAVTNVMHLEDDQGTAAAFWSTVTELRGQLWLPWLLATRP